MKNRKPKQLDLFGSAGTKSQPVKKLPHKTVPWVPVMVSIPAPRVELTQELPALDKILMLPLTYDLTVQVFVSYAVARGVWTRQPGETTPQGLKRVLSHHGAQARPLAQAFRYTQAKLQDCWEIWEGLGRPSRQHVKWINSGQPIGRNVF